MKYLIAVILFSFALTSCTYEPNTSTTTTEDSTATWQRQALTAAPLGGVRYLDKIFTQDQIQKRVEVYSESPRLQLTSYSAKAGIDTAKNRAVIVYCHGGGSDMNCPTCISYGGYFAGLGYVFLSLNYEWQEKFDASAQLKSVFNVWSALNWARFNSRQGHIDTNMIFSMGSSAGAVTVYQANIGSWSMNDTYFNTWATNVNNKGRSTKVLASATLSGASTGIFQRLIPVMQSPNCFYTGDSDEKVPTSRQVADFNLMVSSRVPHLNEPLFAQVIFSNTGHDLRHFDEISQNVAQQFYSLIK